MTDLQTVLDDIAAEMATRTDRGEPATYIPELAKVDSRQFGIAVALADGSVCAAGDAATAFSIQSVSKVFTLTLALGKVGDALWKRVGREPSGDPFNSIVQLEQRAGIPRNPFINAGAIVVTDTVLGSGAPSGAIAEIVAFLRMLSEDDSVSVDEAVAHSEAETGHRNFALARFMKSYGNLSAPADAVLDVYFHQCAIAMSCRQLARAGCFLALGGERSPGGSCVVSEERARRVNALMMMCGHYDGSGDFAFHVGLPGKSGVGGGILAIVPDIASIAVWSPGLNAVGNSKLGSEALEMLTARMGWSVFT